MTKCVINVFYKFRLPFALLQFDIINLDGANEKLYLISTLVCVKMLHDANVVFLCPFIGEIHKSLVIMTKKRFLIGGKE